MRRSTLGYLLWCELYAAAAPLRQHASAALFDRRSEMHVCAALQVQKRLLTPNVLRAVQAPQLKLHALRAERIEQQPRRHVLQRRTHLRPTLWQLLDLRRSCGRGDASPHRRLSRQQPLDLRRDEEHDLLSLADASHAVGRLGVVAED